MNKTVAMFLLLIRCNIISSIKPRVYIKISRKTQCTGLTIKSWGWSVSIDIFCLCWEGVRKATTFSLTLRCYWIQWVCIYDCPSTLSRSPSRTEHDLPRKFALLSNFKYVWSSMYLWLCESIEPGWYKYSNIFVVDMFLYWSIIFTFICILFFNVLVALW